MSIATALVAGGALGVRHALEVDHLAAVAALVDDDQRATASAIVGASWGIGHSLPIVVVGLLLLAVDIRPPESLVRVSEALVGTVLVYLGGRTLAGVLGVVDVERHAHGRRTPHSHLRLGDVSLGVSHQHLDGASFLVGVVHGLAGSGALVVVLVSAAPGFDAAFAFLTAFSLLSITTMGVVSVLWRRTLGTGSTRYLKAAAGTIGIGIGVLLLVEQAAGLGLP